MLKELLQERLLELGKLAAQHLANFHAAEGAIFECKHLFSKLPEEESKPSE